MNPSDDLDALLRRHYARTADTGATEVQISAILRAVADARRPQDASRWVPRTFRRGEGAQGTTTMRLLGFAGLLLVLGGLAAAGSGLLRAPEPMSRTYERVFEPVGSLPAETSTKNLVALPDGDALLIGDPGSDTAEGPNLYRFDGGTGAFTGIGRLALPRWEPEAAVLDGGLVLVVGSSNDARAELVDPRDGTTRLIGSTVHQHAYGYVATPLLDGRVLISDGDPELYDPRSETFTATGPSSDPFRNGHSAVLLRDGRVLVVGGTEDVTSAAEVFDPATGTFEPTGPLAFMTTSTTASPLADGRVLVVDSTGRAQVYDPENDRWTETGSLPEPRGWHGAVTLADGRVLVAGGFGRDAVEEADDAFLYDPDTGAFTVTTAMTTQRVDPFMAMLADGRVLVVGNRCRNSGCYGLGDDSGAYATEPARLRLVSAEIFR